ncbi:MAG: alpha/beta hydrolase family protein, partial [Akkermansiaceae bacterium]
MTHPVASLFLAATLCSFPLSAKDSLTPYTQADQIPKTATTLWAGYDSTAEPLEIKVHHEWKKDGVVSRLVSFKVGTFKGADSRIAAYYCFPVNGKKNPAFVWSHGGGQCADRQRGHYFAKQGFASIDINWLGRPLETDLDPDNKWGTDWGKIDPTQGPRLYKKAHRKGWKNSFHPDAYTIDPIISPRNSNWFMLALAGRRALTFLEQQPEVDASKLGFSGYSMGGTITSMVAIDKRLKAVAPFVGGSGFRHESYHGMNSGNVIRNTGNLEHYKNAIDPAAYWKHVNIPVMFITSSNDFHSHFHRIYQSMHQLPHDNWRVTGNMHANHGPGPEQWILLNHWFKQHLAGKKINVPVTPPST